MLVQPMFIFDMLMQMWQGNIVAWFGFMFLIATCALVALLIVIWWKMPQPARKMFLNELFHHNPTVFNAYDTRVMKVETPKFFREGIGHSKEGGWSFIPRLTKEAGQMFSDSEQDLITKVFTVQGCHSQAYLGYSGKATIVNPELQAFLENAETFTQKSNPDNIVQVPRQAFINALQSLKDEFVQLSPMWVTRLVDPRNLKQNISKAWNKSQLIAMEIAIKEQMRAQMEGSLITIIAILGVAGIVVGVLNLVKIYGLM